MDAASVSTGSSKNILCPDARKDKTKEGLCPASRAYQNNNNFKFVAVPTYWHVVHGKAFTLPKAAPASTAAGGGSAAAAGSKKTTSGGKRDRARAFFEERATTCGTTYNEDEDGIVDDRPVEETPVAVSTYNVTE